MCYVNDVVCSMVVFTHCTVTSQGLTVTDENHKGYIFPILSITVPLSSQAKSLIRLLIFTLADLLRMSLMPNVWYGLSPFSHGKKTKIILFKKK